MKQLIATIRPNTWAIVRVYSDGIRTYGIYGMPLERFRECVARAYRAINNKARSGYSKKELRLKDRLARIKRWNDYLDANPYMVQAQKRKATL